VEGIKKGPCGVLKGEKASYRRAPLPKLGGPLILESLGPSGQLSTFKEGTLRQGRGEHDELRVGELAYHHEGLPDRRGDPLKRGA